MNTTKLIPLVLTEFILTSGVGVFSVKITQNTDIIFNPLAQLAVLAFLILGLLLISILGGLIIGVIRDVRFSLLIALISFIGYLIGTIELLKIDGTVLLFFIQTSLVLLGILSSFLQFNSEMKDSINFKIGRLTSNSFKTFFGFFAISLSIIFYISNSSITLENILTDQLLDKFIDPITIVLEKQINNQITSQISNQMSALNINLASNMDSILPMIKEEVKGSIAKNYSVDLDTKNIGVIYDKNSNEFKVTGLSTIIKPIIKATVDKYTKPYEKYIPLTITFVFYLTIVWVLSLSRLLTKPMAFIIEEILIKLGYIKKTNEMIEVERISL